MYTYTETPTYRYRFWRRHKDGSLEFVYKLTQLAVKRAYLKQTREPGEDYPEFGWETFEHPGMYFGRHAWLDVHTILPSPDTP